MKIMDLRNELRNSWQLIILSIIGVILVLISTSLYGVGISTDSVTYISIARNILYNFDYSRYDGVLGVTFPPLFPLILSFTISLHPGIFVAIIGLPTEAASNKHLGRPSP